MDEKIVKETVQTVMGALAELEEAKAACTDLVESALDAAGAMGDARKNIKRVAKALLEGKVPQLKRETDNLIETCDFFA